MQVSDSALADLQTQQAQNLAAQNAPPPNPNPWGLTAKDFPAGSLQLPAGTPGIDLSGTATASPAITDWRSAAAPDASSTVTQRAPYVAPAPALPPSGTTASAGPSPWSFLDSMTPATASPAVTPNPGNPWDASNQPVGFGALALPPPAPAPAQNGDLGIMTNNGAGGGGLGAQFGRITSGLGNAASAVHNAYTTANNAATGTGSGMDPFWNPTTGTEDPRSGGFLQNIQTSPLEGTGLNAAIPNLSLLPLRSVTDFLTSPMGAASIVAPTALGAAGAGALPGLGGLASEAPLESGTAAAKFGLSTLGAFGAQNAANKYLPTDYPGAGLVNNFVVPAIAGALTHKVAGAAIDAAPALGRSLTSGALSGELGGGGPFGPPPPEGEIPPALPEPVSPALPQDTAPPMADLPPTYEPPTPPNSIIGGATEAKLRLLTGGNMMRGLPEEPGATVGGLLPHTPLGPDATFEDALALDKLLSSHVTGVTQALKTEAVQAENVLGKMVQGPDKNWYLPDVPASPTEIELAQSASGNVNDTALGKMASVQRVIERPNDYPTLTPDQRAAAMRLNQITQDVAATQDAAGVPRHELSLNPEEQIYQNRSVSVPTEASRAEALVNNPNTTTGDFGKSSGAGRALSIAKDKPRIFEDPAEAIAQGQAYDKPSEAVAKQSGQRLRAAAGAFAKEAYAPFGETVADRYPAGMQDSINALRDKISSLSGKLDTAENRAGLATKQGAELAKPIAKLGDLTDKATARAALDDAQKELTTARQNALATAKSAGTATAEDAAAMKRLAAAETGLLKAKARITNAMGMGEVTSPGTGVRLRPVDSAVVRAAVDEAANATSEMRKLNAARGVAFNTGPEADLAKGFAQAGAGGLKTAESTAIGAAKNLAPDQVYSALLQMKNRAAALAARGGQWSGLADSIKQELDATQAQFDQLQPEWAQARRVAESTLSPGYARVPMEQAPALAGTSYPADMAQKISELHGGYSVNPIKSGLQHLDQGITANAGHALNALHTIGDGASLFRLALTALVKSPIAWEKAVQTWGHGLISDSAFADAAAKVDVQAAADGTASVRDMAASGLDIPSHQLADINSPLVSRVVNKVPVLNRTQAMFSNFVGSLRINMWKQLEGEYTNAGIDTTRQDVRELISRNVNRGTGSTGVRIPGATSLIAFPQWTISSIDFAIKAAADGTLEGAYAREAILKSLGMWTGAAVAVNTAQGKKTDFSNGLPTMSLPNGSQLSMPGKYGSLIKGAIYAATRRDPTYAIRSNINPAFGMGWDLVTGKDFSGKPVSWTDPMYWARALAPFNIANVGKESGTNIALSDFGLHARQQTPYETRDTAIAAAGLKQADGSPVTSWAEMSPSQQRAWKADPTKPQYQSPNPAVLKAQADMAWAKQQNHTDLTQLDQNYQPGQAWRDQYHNIQAAAQGRFDALQQANPYTGPQNTTPEAQALNAWDATIKQNTVAGKVNWAPVDAWMASNPQQAELVNNYLAGGKPSDIKSVAAYKQANTTIGNSGFFTIGDKVWQGLQGASGGALASYKSLADYQQAIQAEIAKQAPTLSPEARQLVYNKVIAADKYIATYDRVKKAVDNAWAIHNPVAMDLAVRWGYIQTPTKTEKKIIAATAKMVP